MHYFVMDRYTEIWDLEAYQTSNGKVPFIEWLETLDGTTQKRIEVRLGRLRYGNFGDCKSIANGLFELRFSFGGGYRIYYGRTENRIILLLCGGEKDTQQRDIEQAKYYWKQYQQERS